MLRFPGRAKFHSLATDEAAHVTSADPVAESHCRNSFQDPTSSTHHKANVTANSVNEDPRPEPQTLKPYDHRWLALAARFIAITPFFCLAWAAVGLHGRGTTQDSWNRLQIAMKVVRISDRCNIQ
jgi:hypothetical protein